MLGNSLTPLRIGKTPDAVNIRFVKRARKTVANAWVDIDYSEGDVDNDFKPHPLSFFVAPHGSIPSCSCQRLSEGYGAHNYQGFREEGNGKVSCVSIDSNWSSRPAIKSWFYYDTVLKFEAVHNGMTFDARKVLFYEETPIPDQRDQWTMIRHHRFPPLIIGCHPSTVLVTPTAPTPATAIRSSSLGAFDKLPLEVIILILQCMIFLDYNDETLTAMQAKTQAFNDLLPYEDLQPH
ncbi:hypothetical protein DFJ77DRAFT_252485 [Powellomyces hirtus]|nr:hypothetical protein DFJ77DRAFT_252485 [Powellomyces hirtus]